MLGVTPKADGFALTPREINFRLPAAQIYLDDSFRMAKDSRGVLLIVEKQ